MRRLAVGALVFVAGVAGELVWRWAKVVPETPAGAAAAAATPDNVVPLYMLSGRPLRYDIGDLE